MSSFRWFAVAASIGASAIVSFSACGSDPTPPPIAVAGASGAPFVVDNPGAGRSAAGSGGAGSSAGSTAAGAGGAGSGGATAGAGGAAGTAAGSGGAAAGSGGATTAGSGGSSGQGGAGGAPEEEDPFGGLFPTEPVCDGLLCLEDADCASLYPDEAASCKFTKCVDFVCN